jgi:hypothetical protein
VAGTFTGSPERIADRTEFILDIARSLFESGVLDENRIVLRESRIKLCVEAYFLLNAAYKKWRIISGHNTELPKVAAMTAMVIVRLQPFRPIDLDNVRNRAEAQSNAILAYAVATALLGIESDYSAKNFHYRLLDYINESGSETIEPYIVDKNLHNNRELDSYDLTIHAKDKDRANALITILELMVGDLD